MWVVLLCQGDECPIYCCFFVERSPFSNPHSGSKTSLGSPPPRGTLNLLPFFAGLAILGKKQPLNRFPGLYWPDWKAAKLSSLTLTHYGRERGREKEKDPFDRRQAQTKPIQVDQFKESFEKIFIFPEGLPSIWEVWETLLLHEMCVCELEQGRLIAPKVALEDVLSRT